MLEDYGNNYSPSDLPPAAADAVFNDPFFAGYISGNEVVYAYTPEADGYVFATANADGYQTSMFVLTGCPFSSTCRLGFRRFPRRS
ncbi:hypothetical protein G3O08_03640 [Cryomorpha ignava]|uniref:Uncharacterized protein n=1 Tax=Cryomorpha ignava TaxID=101383 RepID=A0A7K3WLR6_9FLAO|nr:hypothetical protein [Cryomorpha ignava]NEN22596.1 hypothetical protein [Cryomorpha ignava]